MREPLILMPDFSKRNAGLDRRSPERHDRLDRQWAKPTAEPLEPEITTQIATRKPASTGQAIPIPRSRHHPNADTLRDSVTNVPASTDTIRSRRRRPDWRLYSVGQRTARHGFRNGKRTNPRRLPARESDQADRMRRIRNGAPDRIRTCDPCLRRAILYPAELRARGRYSRMGAGRAHLCQDPILAPKWAGYGRNG